MAGCMSRFLAMTPPSFGGTADDAALAGPDGGGGGGGGSGGGGGGGTGAPVAAYSLGSIPVHGDTSMRLPLSDAPESDNASSIDALSVKRTRPLPTGIPILSRSNCTHTMSPHSSKYSSKSNRVTVCAMLRTWTVRQPAGARRRGWFWPMAGLAFGLLQLEAAVLRSVVVVDDEDDRDGGGGIGGGGGCRSRREPSGARRGSRGGERSSGLGRLEARLVSTTRSAGRLALLLLSAGAAPLRYARRRCADLAVQSRCCCHQKTSRGLDMPARVAVAADRQGSGTRGCGNRRLLARKIAARLTVSTLVVAALAAARDAAAIYDQGV